MPRGRRRRQAPPGAESSAAATESDSAASQSSTLGGPASASAECFSPLLAAPSPGILRPPEEQQEARAGSIIRDAVFIAGLQNAMELQYGFQQAWGMAKTLDERAAHGAIVRDLFPD